jgi:hypothetical protein
VAVAIPSIAGRTPSSGKTWRQAEFAIASANATERQIQEESEDGER